jgi:hypothetical protein
MESHRVKGNLSGANDLPSLPPPAIEIEHYGERLVGCIECNRWSLARCNRLFMELPEKD